MLLDDDELYDLLVCNMETYILVGNDNNFMLRKVTA